MISDQGQAPAGEIAALARELVGKDRAGHGEHLPVIYYQPGNRAGSWRAVCAAAPARRKGRWKVGQGVSPEAALRALLREVRAVANR